VIHSISFFPETTRVVYNKGLPPTNEKRVVRTCLEKTIKTLLRIGQTPCSTEHS